MAVFTELFKSDLNYLNTPVFRHLPLTRFSQLSNLSKRFQYALRVDSLRRTVSYSIIIPRQNSGQMRSRLFDSATLASALVAIHSLLVR